VLFSLCIFDLVYFELQKDLSSFYYFKFRHTIPQHRTSLATSYSKKQIH
jgi:hypothetical protein